MATNWQTAQVRINGKGKVEVKVNPNSKFAECVAKVSKRKGIRSPSGVCAAAGRKKYGKKKFAAMAKAGRRKRR